MLSTCSRGRHDMHPESRLDFTSNIPNPGGRALICQQASTPSLLTHCCWCRDHWPWPRLWRGWSGGPRVSGLQENKLGVSTKLFSQTLLQFTFILTSSPVLALALEAVEVEVGVCGPGWPQLALDVTGEAAELPHIGVCVTNGVTSPRPRAPQPQAGLEAETVFEHHRVPALHLGCHPEKQQKRLNWS